MEDVRRLCDWMRFPLKNSFAPDIAFISRFYDRFGLTKLSEMYLYETLTAGVAVTRVKQVNVCPPVFPFSIPLSLLL